MKLINRTIATYGIILECKYCKFGSNDSRYFATPKLCKTCQELGT